MTVKVTQKSIGFTGLLCLIFIALKLTKVISWSWLWVLSPLWISAAITIILIIIHVILDMRYGE